MRIIIADRDPSTCSALTMLFQMDARIQVVGAASEIDEVLSRLRSECSDLLLFDWDGMSAEIGMIRNAMAALTNPPLIIGMSVRRENRQAVLAEGATEFVCKGDPPECLKAVIREVDPLLRP